MGGLSPKDLGRNMHGPISLSHPKKIPSNIYWVLKIHGRNSKERNFRRSRGQIADRIIALRPSDYSSPKEKGYCQVQQGMHGIHRPPQATTQPE